MNILYLISIDAGKGVGGHYNSLYQVSLEVSKQHKVKIVSLGSKTSPIVKSSPYFEKHISLNHSFYDCYLLNRELKKINKEFKTDIIHCFDTNSLNRVLVTSCTKKIPIVLNKCGGRNPKKNNYQHANAIVVFSKENESWFHLNKNYDNSRIFNIPNRVRKLRYLPLEEQREKSDSEKISFVRVSRLGGAYEMTLKQTFSLLDKLSKKYLVEFFVVGKVHDEKKFSKIKAIAESKPYPVYFITDNRASKGSDFLYLADFVVGTGRSFMEATSLGIPTLTPAKNTQIPILVDKNNVHSFLETNFSERNIAPNKSESKTIEKIESLITSKVLKENFKNETKDVFIEHFGTEKILEKYDLVYEKVIDSNPNRYKLLVDNFPYLLKFLLKGN